MLFSGEGSAPLPPGVWTRKGGLLWLNLKFLWCKLDGSTQPKKDKCQPAKNNPGSGERITLSGGSFSSRKSCVREPSARLWSSWPKLTGCFSPDKCCRRYGHKRLSWNTKLQEKDPDNSRRDQQLPPQIPVHSWTPQTGSKLWLQSWMKNAWPTCQSLKPTAS